MTIRLCLLLSVQALVALQMVGCEVSEQEWKARLADWLRRLQRCPVVATEMVLEKDGERPRTVLSMDETGSVSVALAAGEVARLDPRGCLYGPDGVWVEETRDGRLWTLRGVTPLVDGVLQLGARGLQIRDDGLVVEVPPAQPAGIDVGTFRFTGLQPSGRCAARILLQAWLLMMPSMAVSDGNPVKLAPPADSVCPDRHEPLSTIVPATDAGLPE